MGVITPEAREKAHQKSRLTSIRKRVEKYTTGEPEPTAEDRWILAMDAVAGWAPPNPKVRDWLRSMLDMTADEDRSPSPGQLPLFEVDEDGNVA